MQFEWTETPNVWKCDPKAKTVTDVGVVVYNYGESYGNQKNKFENLKKQGDYIYTGIVPEIDNKLRDYCLYIYSEEDPSKFYKAVNISKGGSILNMDDGAHDVTVNNMEFLYGQDYYFLTNPKNIVISDFIFGWQGGQTQASTKARYGGGGGAWLSCDNLVFDHCYMYQQFDCAVTPQLDGSFSGVVGIFNKFIVKNCLIENAEYGFEYFSTQKNTDDNKLTNMYLGYNFFHDIGDGFGIKPNRSACVKSWEHENTTYDSVI